MPFVSSELRRDEYSFPTVAIAVYKVPGTPDCHVYLAHVQGKLPVYQQAMWVPAALLPYPTESWVAVIRSVLPHRGSGSVTALLFPVLARCTALIMTQVLTIARSTHTHPQRAKTLAGPSFNCCIGSRRLMIHVQKYEHGVRVFSLDLCLAGCRALSSFRDTAPCS